MDERATGLVLRTRPLTETSLLVHWLTRDSGRLVTVAKGARRRKSPFGGKLDLFFEADFSFARSRRSDLHALREVALRDAHEALRHDLAYIQQASYCAALVEQATETDAPLPTIYELTASLLDYLPKQAAQPLTIFAFEMRLLTELGLRPDLAQTKLSRGARKILELTTIADSGVNDDRRLAGSKASSTRRRPGARDQPVPGRISKLPFGANPSRTQDTDGATVGRRLSCPPARAQKSTARIRQVRVECADDETGRDYLSGAAAGRGHGGRFPRPPRAG